MNFLTQQRLQPQTLFPGHNLQIKAPKGGVCLREKPIHRSRAFFDIFFHLKKSGCGHSIAFIVLLTVASVFLIVRNKLKTGPLPSIYAHTAEMPHDSSVRKPEHSAPVVSHTENELLRVMHRQCMNRLPWTES